MPATDGGPSGGRLIMTSWHSEYASASSGLALDPWECKVAYSAVTPGLTRRTTGTSGRTEAGSASSSESSS